MKALHSVDLPRDLPLRLISHRRSIRAKLIKKCQKEVAKGRACKSAWCMKNAGSKSLWFLAEAIYKSFCRFSVDIKVHQSLVTLYSISIYIVHCWNLKLVSYMIFRGMRANACDNIVSSQTPTSFATAGYNLTNHTLLLQDDACYNVVLSILYIYIFFFMKNNFFFFVISRQLLK